MEKTTSDTSGHLWWEKTTTTEVPLDERRVRLQIAIGLFIAAAVCLLAALRLITAQGRFNRYLAILTGIESIEVERIAAITRYKARKVCGDIQCMIDSGMVSDFYVDHQVREVVSKKYTPKTSHKTVVTCSGCGGRNELIIGITRYCKSCGEPLLLSYS